MLQIPLDLGRYFSTIRIGVFVAGVPTIARLKICLERGRKSFGKQGAALTGCGEQCLGSPSQEERQQYWPRNFQPRRRTATFADGCARQHNTASDIKRIWQVGWFEVTKYPWRQRLFCYLHYLFRPPDLFGHLRNNSFADLGLRALPPFIWLKRDSLTRRQMFRSQSSPGSIESQSGSLSII